MTTRSRLTAFVVATLIATASTGAALGRDATPAASVPTLPGVGSGHQAECGTASPTRGPLGY